MKDNFCYCCWWRFPPQLTVKPLVEANWSITSKAARPRAITTKRWFEGPVILHTPWIQTSTRLNINNFQNTWNSSLPTLTTPRGSTSKTNSNQGGSGVSAMMMMNSAKCGWSLLETIEHQFDLQKGFSRIEQKKLIERIFHKKSKHWSKLDQVNCATVKYSDYEYIWKMFTPWKIFLLEN